MKYYITFFNGGKKIVSKKTLIKISEMLDGQGAIWYEDDFPSLSFEEDKQIKNILKQLKLDKKVSKSIDKLLK